MVQVAGVVLRVSAAEGDARGVAILFVDVAPATATAHRAPGAPRGHGRLTPQRREHGFRGR